MNVAAATQGTDAVNLEQLQQELVRSPRWPRA
ncbi:hypothetical protein [Cupriavidus pauculus]